MDAGTMDTGAEPAETDPADTAEDQGPQGYCIEIHVSADNKITVGVESEEDEEGEESGTPDDGAQPVDGIKGALALVLDIFKNGGQVADAAAGNGDFDSGFNQDQSGGSQQAALAKRFA